MPRSRRAHVSTDDLEQALDYLEGLVLVLEEFARTQRGRDHPDELTQRLENMDSQGGNWSTLRHQVGAGAGWHEIAEQIGELRLRLLAGYSEAAL